MTKTRPGVTAESQSPCRIPEEAFCWICGGTEDLVCDEYTEEIYYCRTCFQKGARQQRAIDEGLQDEPDIE